MSDDSGPRPVPAEPVGGSATSTLPVPATPVAGGPATPVAQAAAGEGEAEPEDDGPGPEPVLHCVLCGSASLHESDHSSLAALRARAGGATVFTCRDCRHRFAVRLFGHVHRHRRRGGHSQHARDRRIRLRRRLFYWIWIVLGGLLTASVVYYFLERDTQRSLTPPESAVSL